MDSAVKSLLAMSSYSVASLGCMLLPAKGPPSIVSVSGMYSSKASIELISIFEIILAAVLFKAYLYSPLF